ncbi:MAG: hypothetical protein V3V54_00915 [Candidatus Brocadiales bacterium]
MEYYKQRWSIFAIVSLAMGVLSLITFFLIVHVAIMVIQILLAVGAIITGYLGMRATRAYPLRGHNLAYAGLVCGGNGLFWVVINLVFGLFR